VLEDGMSRCAIVCLILLFIVWLSLSVLFISINFSDICLKCIFLSVGWLEFNVPFQHKYGCIRDEHFPANVACSFLQLIIPTLPHVRLPSSDAERGDLFWKHESDAVETLLLDFMMDVLLLPYK